ncbi:hypothetical protein GPECTOR_30g148 [Gonium pectorale]|uniref:Uncharacterized protein n=1 Tax=Gonium pectorale TaxID=33097 RepID=A0A150GE53_GONPE|nr:hypothetical protein GPECTOR_30g148 [Gonium pectorale]|eukprot:KXZ48053.1 hypothetical protein GPECTOR_30g148 [Gonium pectorale]
MDAQRFPSLVTAVENKCRERIRGLPDATKDILRDSPAGAPVLQVAVEDASRTPDGKVGRSRGAALIRFVEQALTHGSLMPPHVNTAPPAQGSLAIIGVSTCGKTTMLEQQGLCLLPDALPPRGAAGWGETEAAQLLLLLGSGLQDGEEHLLQQELRRPAASTPKKRLKEVAKLVQQAREYKLGRNDYTPPGLLLPAGNQGSIGSSVTVLISGARYEFQVLLMLEPREALEDQLMQHMDVVEGRRGAKALSADVKSHLASMWQRLTPPGTAVRDEVQRRREAAREHARYAPPLREVATRLAGRAYIARSGVATSCPAGPPTAQSCTRGRGRRGGGGGAAADLSTELLEELLFTGNFELVAQDRDDVGPWRMLLEGAGSEQQALREARELLLCLTQRIQIFIPSELLIALDLTLVDSIGFDDPNPRRRMLQRRLEEGLQHMVLLAERSLSTMGPVLEHLAESPFMAKWIRAHLLGQGQGQAEEGGGEQLPTLSVMIFREKTGLRVGTSDRVTFATLNAAGEEVVAVLDTVVHDSRAALAGLLREVVTWQLGLQQQQLHHQQQGQQQQRQLEQPEQMQQQGQRQLEQPDQQQHGKEGASEGGGSDGHRWRDGRYQLLERVEALAMDIVPVYFSFPMLGLALFQALDQRRGSRSAPPAAATAAARRRPPTAASAIEVELEAALGRTNLDEFLASMAQAQVDAARAAVRRYMGACRAAAEEVEQELWALERLLTRTDCRLPATKHNSSAKALEALSMQIGQDSEYKMTVHRAFARVYMQFLEPRLDALVAGEVKERLRQAAGRVAGRLIDRFKLEAGDEDGGKGLDGLLQATDPRNDWGWRGAPISTWLKNELASVGPLEGLRALLSTQLLPVVQRVCEELLAGVLVEFSGLPRDSHEQEAAARKLVSSLLQELSVADQVKKAFAALFHGNRANRTMPVTEYNRLLEVALEGEYIRRWLRTQLHDDISRKVDNGQSAEEVAGALRTWFRDQLVEGIVRRSNNGFHARLRSALFDKVIGLRYRLYDNGLGCAGAKGRWSTVLMRTFKHFMHNLSEEKDIFAAKKAGLQQAVQELRGLEADLVQLQEPDQQDAALAAAGSACAAAAGGPSAATTATAVKEEAAAVVEALLEAGQGLEARLLLNSWSNGLGGWGASATRRQLAAFRAHLDKLGYELVDCPGVGNSCGYFAVLSQALGIPLDGTDAVALRTVAEYRRRVADELARVNAAEEAPPEEGETAAAAGPEAPVRGLCTAVILSLEGAPPAGAEAAAAVVRKHVEGVRDDAPMTHLELSVLCQLLGVSVTMYNPTYAASGGYKSECDSLASVGSGVSDGGGADGGAGGGRAVRVLVATVPSGEGRRELDHFNVVRPRASGPQQQQPGDGGGEGAPGARVSSKQPREVGVGDDGAAGDAGAAKRQRST